MPNIASVLKDEIRRLARKEIKAETSKTKNAVVQYRREIAKLKQVLAAQQKEIARLKSRGKSSGAVEEAESDELDGIRFSARSVRAQRTRLGLSAADYGKLVGVSGLTIYSWEKGASRPRKPQLKALVDVRGIGKREARARVEAEKTEPPARSRRAKKG
jgi:DNA-binding transcriptional regulator YiaG